MWNLEKILLAKDLHYALPLIKLNYDDYMTPFELFHHEIRKLPIELEKVKTVIKKEAYSTFDNYNIWNELNSSRPYPRQREKVKLNFFSTFMCGDLKGFKKALKGNSVVLVNKAD